LPYFGLSKASINDTYQSLFFGGFMVAMWRFSMVVAVLGLLALIAVKISQLSSSEVSLALPSVSGDRLS
jgi:hypothetical protein